MTAQPDGGTEYVHTDAIATHTVDSDSAGRVLSDRTVSAGGAVMASQAFSYDAYGKVLTKTEGSQTTAWTYDAVGHKTSETLAAGTLNAVTTHYVYDAAGELLSLTDPNGNVTSYFLIPHNGGLSDLNRVRQSLGLAAVRPGQVTNISSIAGQRSNRTFFRWFTSL